MAETNTKPRAGVLPGPYRILIACAFDETADWALLEGLRLAASQADSELHVVHAVEGAAYTAADDVLQAASAEMRRTPDLLRARIERLWDTAAAARRQVGAEAQWCERHAQEHPRPHVYIPRHEARTSVMPTY